MKAYINKEQVNGPWGGGANWVRAMYEYLPKFGHEVALPNDFRATPDVIFLAGLEGDGTMLSAEQSISYQMFAPSTKIILRVNECDARKATSGVDEDLINISKYVNGTVFVSEWLQDYFMKLGWHCKNNAVIINGVDLNVFKPQPKLNNGKTNILMSHWSDNALKGQDYAEWLDDFVGKHEDFTFTFVGRTKAKLKNGKLIHPLHGSALGDELTKYDVCINATRHDPGPNSVSEPITCDVPTYVHCDGGGAVEFAGKDHVFSSFDDVERLLLSKNFTKNKTSFEPWKSSIEKYLTFTESVK